MLYHHANLSKVDLGLIRLGGPGLGNLMFPISRALIGQQKNGGEFLHPTISQLKLGPLLRSENDKRFYLHEFKKRTVRQTFKNALLPHIYRRQSETTTKHTTSNNTVIFYQGLKNYFKDLDGYQNLLSTYFSKVSRYPLLKTNTNIRVHIRHGDFKSQKPIHPGQHSIRQEMSWYRKTTEQIIKDNSIHSPKIIVHTDGDKAEITRQFSDIPIQFDDSRSAISSILKLTDCDHLVCSRSTFSLWGAFLGDSIVYIEKDFEYENTINLDQRRVRKV